MIALPATLIKILLISTLVTALAPLFVRRHNNNVLLLPIAACFLESLTITYFYIYAGRASWKLLSVRGVDIEFYIEPLGLIFLNLLTGLWLISTLYTIYHMKKIDKKDPGTFLTFIGLTIFSAILVALSKNLFTMFIGYEMLTLSTIPLVAYHSYNKPEIIKYIKILLSTSIGLLLPFVLLIDHITGSTEFKLGGIILNEIPDFWGHLLLLLSFFGIAKTAIFPFHSWLTSAMIAPYPVSALLHAVAVVKAGLFCMMKIIIYIFGISYLYNLLEYFNWPLVMAVVTLLYASYMAVSTNIVKHVLAYSTIANLALVLMSLFVLSNKSIIAGLSHMIVHSFAKITLFFAAGIFYTQVQSTSLNELRGIGYKSPIAAIFFLIAAFSMIGIPPLAGANSKQLIWNSIVESNYSYTLKPVLILYILATIIYMGKLSYLLFAKDANFTSKVSRGGMEFALALTTIPLAAFPLIERYLDSILWSIL